MFLKKLKNLKILKILKNPVFIYIGLIFLVVFFQRGGREGLEGIEREDLDVAITDKPECENFCKEGTTCTPACEKWGCANCGGVAGTTAAGAAAETEMEAEMEAEAGAPVGDNEKLQELETLYKLLSTVPQVRRADYQNKITTIENELGI